MTTSEQTSTSTAQESALTPRIPVATYRLQFNKNFTFQQARWLASYLHTLGITDAYASPYFKARAESTHGYDIADHNQLNPAIGSEDDYNAFVAELQHYGMGQVLDTVPNHMGIGEPNNAWWVDVLENGPSSLYASFFDIDWHPLKDELANKVLLPILGEQYGRVLEKGELQLRYEDGAFFLDYYENELPVNPRTYASILETALDHLLEVLGLENEHMLEYQSIMTALNNLPPRTETDRAKVLERRREKEVAKRRLGVLTAASPVIHEAIQASVRLFNGASGEARSFDLLDGLINNQAYRLSYWRVAAEEINYRRFFDVNDLAAIRMENEEVFQATHELMGRLLAEGKVTGVRLDHPDGLWDPAGHFARLQTFFKQLHTPEGEGEAEEAEPAAQTAPEKPLYMLVEKILGHGETLPKDWAVHGTTGYEYLNLLNGVFVDASAEKQFNDIYFNFIDHKINFEELVYDSKKKILAVSLASELNVLSYQLTRIAEQSRYYRDFTLYSLRSVLREVVACFPVYRTYIVASTDRIEERDIAYIDIAIARAKRRNPLIEASTFDFLSDLLKLRYPASFEGEARDAQRTFVMKFQQITGPVMAKGLEDTAFYIYNRLISLNEVGGEPQYFGTSTNTFHRQNQDRLRDWPGSMLASSTHDTKRSEDVRARINVLSEVPKEWRSTLSRLSRLNSRKKIEIDGEQVPDRNEEYLLYQTLLGSWPLAPMDHAARDEYIERIQAYMQKATREAKAHTSWLTPNAAYDDAVAAFAKAVVEDQRFAAQLDALRRKVSHFGMFNSLSQQLLKLTSPGVPDIYQGTEAWDLSLVDPDNRRAVDYDLRRWWLGELIDEPANRAELARSLVDTRADGRIKLYLTHRALVFRRDHAALFGAGSYLPLEATGNAAEHVVAFARVHRDFTAVTVAPRLLAKRLGETDRLPLGADAWGDELLVLGGAVAGQRFRNVFTGEVVETVERDGAAGLLLADVLANFPVALLTLQGTDTAA